MQKATAVLSFRTQIAAAMKPCFNLHALAAPPALTPLQFFWLFLVVLTQTRSLSFFIIPVQERRMPPPVPKKPLKGHPPLARDRSLESSERQRLEARKRLLAAKRAASVRQSSATESADSIEIYIPEAQTRL